MAPQQNLASELSQEEVAWWLPRGGGGVESPPNRTVSMQRGSFRDLNEPHS